MMLNLPDLKYLKHLPNLPNAVECRKSVMYFLNGPLYGYTYYIIKQWLLAPSLQDSRVTHANLARRVPFFSKMAFGECR